MSQVKKDKKPKVAKKPRTFEEMSVAAKKAVETRRVNDPSWGEKKRFKEAERKKKIESRSS